MLKKKFTWWKIVLAGSLILNAVFLGSGGFGKINESRAVSVIKVVDGDTFDVDSGERVRLNGIDAPEYPKGCLSKRAKDRLEELVLGKKVSLEELGKDNFGRVLAQVKLEDLWINKVLVTEGLAAAAKGAGVEVELAETEAMAAKRGIWSSECTAEQEGCEIKGNFHKGTKDRVYHLPGCYNYNQVVINPNEGDRWFCTEAEAQAAGFERAKDCPGDR